MLDRARKLWDIHCRPRPKVDFTVVDEEKEEKVPDNTDSIDIHVYFVT